MKRGYCKATVVLPLIRPPTSSSLKITDGSFCYGSFYLWNQLSISSLSVNLILAPVFSTANSLIPSPVTSSSFDSPLFYNSHCRSHQTFNCLFHKSIPHSIASFPGMPSRTSTQTVSSELLRFFYFSPLFFVFGSCTRLSWPFHQVR